VRVEGAGGAQQTGRSPSEMYGIVAYFGKRFVKETRGKVSRFITAEFFSVDRDRLLVLVDVLGRSASRAGGPTQNIPGNERVVTAGGD